MGFDFFSDLKAMIVRWFLWKYIWAVRSTNMIDNFFNLIILLISSPIYLGFLSFCLNLLQRHVVTLD